MSRRSAEAPVGRLKAFWNEWGMTALAVLLIGASFVYRVAEAQTFPYNEYVAMGLAAEGALLLVKSYKDELNR
jgi:hypothetical protein